MLTEAYSSSSSLMMHLIIYFLVVRSELINTISQNQYGWYEWIIAADKHTRYRHVHVCGILRVLQCRLQRPWNADPRCSWISGQMLTCKIYFVATLWVGGWPQAAPPTNWWKVEGLEASHPTINVVNCGFSSRSPPMILLEPPGPIMVYAIFNTIVAAGFPVQVLDCKDEHQQPWWPGGVDLKVGHVSPMPPIPMRPCNVLCVQVLKLIGLPQVHYFVVTSE